MIKAYKVKLSPNNVQNSRMFQYAGAARFTYNWVLDKQKDNHLKGLKFITYNTLSSDFTQFKKKEENLWLNNISANVTQQAIKDACNAHIRFFKNIGESPNYKSRKTTTPSFYQGVDKITFTPTHVRIEKISTNLKRSRQKVNFIKLCEKNKIPANVKYMNPRFTHDGENWYVSVAVEHEDININSTNEPIGIDLGIKTLAVCSDGKSYYNINKKQTIKKLQKKKRRLQRKVSKKYVKNKKGDKFHKTNNIIKLEKSLLKLTHRIINIRNDYLHKVTSDIISREPSEIILEDLNIKGMMKNKHLSKAIQEQSFYEFRRQIEYKASNLGIKVTIADRWYPSSKLCSCCGVVKKDLKLKDRIFKCDCGNIIDRDLQAAINLKNYSNYKKI